MATKSAVLVLTLYLSLASGQGRKTRASPLNGLLQNILSPSNTDGAVQFLKQLASRRGYPVAEERIISNGLVQHGVPGCGNQRVVLPNQCGNQLVIPNQQVQQLLSQQIVLPNQQYVLPNQQIYPQQVVLPQQQLLPQQVIVPQQQLLPQQVVLPQQQLLPQQVILPQPQQVVQQRLIEVESYVPQIEVQRVAPVIQSVQTVQGPVTTPLVVEKPCSCSAPAPLVNPFLPAASPVSAIAPPVSNLLPPAELNNCRCQYLRKIPIPPPCL